MLEARGQFLPRGIDHAVLFQVEIDDDATRCGDRFNRRHAGDAG